MKLNKLFFIGLATLAFAACNNDDKDAGNGLTSGVPTTMAINIDMVKTYATEAGLPVESAITGTVKVVVLSGSGIETVADVTSDAAGQTAKLQTTSGSKLIYVLVNAPATPAINTAIGTSKEAFEKQILELDLATVTADNEFFMTNVESPSAVFLTAGVADPVVETKNIVPIKAARLAAKIETKVTATNHVNGTGVLSAIEYKTKNIATKSYLVGQKNGANNIFTPYYDKLAGVYVGPAPVPYPDYTNETAFKAIPGISYTLENNHIQADESEGSTTRIVVKGVFTPTALVDAADGTTPVVGFVTGNDFWAVYDGITLKGYTDADPTGNAWAATPAIIKKRTAGECFYNIWIAGAGSTVPPYTVIRNNVYKINITDINGIGTDVEDGGLNPDPVTPIEVETQMVVRLEVLDWTIVEQPTVIE